MSLTSRLQASKRIRSIWWLAVDQRDPGAAVFGVAPLGFVEDASDHGGGIFDDAGSQPFVARHRSRGRLVAWRLVAGEDVGRGARRRLGVVDRADLSQSRRRDRRR